MRTRASRAAKGPSFIAKAEKALRIAVAKTIEDHRRSGHPIVVWKNGRVVRIPASRIPRARRASA